MIMAWTAIICLVLFGIGCLYMAYDCAFTPWGSIDVMGIFFSLAIAVACFGGALAIHDADLGGQPKAQSQVEAR